MANRTVEIPENVDRVVAVGSGSLRHIAYLQAVDKVVGVEEYAHEDDAVPHIIANKEKYSELPTVGPNHGGDAELIAGANPQVIFYGDSCGDVSDAEKLQSKTGIPVIYVEMGDLYNYRDTLYECWDTYAKVLDKEDRADELKDYTDSLISDFDERTKDIPDDEKTSAYVGGVSHRGGHDIQGTRAPYPSLQFINADDPTEELGHEEVTPVDINREKILEWNPDVIFTDLGNLELVKENFDDNSAYEDLKAYKEDQIHGIFPTSSYNRNIESTLANTYYIGHVVYPEKFSVDPEEKTDEIYEKFLGESVYDEMEDQLGGYGKLDI